MTNCDGYRQLKVPELISQTRAGGQASVQCDNVNSLLPVKLSGDFACIAWGITRVRIITKGLVCEGTDYHTVKVTLI